MDLVFVLVDFEATLSHKGMEELGMAKLDANLALPTSGSSHMGMSTFALEDGHMIVCLSSC